MSVWAVYVCCACVCVCVCVCCEQMRFVRVSPVCVSSSVPVSVFVPVCLYVGQIVGQVVGHRVCVYAAPGVPA